MQQEPATSSPPSSPPRTGFLTGAWPQRLAAVIDMMREMSSQTDPQRMYETFVARMRKVTEVDGSVSLSRRNLQFPNVRITRSSLWQKDVNPWLAKEHVILNGGLFSEMIWKEQPVIINDLKFDPSDPAAPYLQDMRSAIALPLFDNGMGLNMVMQFRREPNAFAYEDLPERVWMSNLFGRATHNLLLSGELKKAYEAVDHEMQVVADMQRSLLPRKLPEIPGVDIAAHYQTSRRAGGDYYDFFPLPNGHWGILIADVSGHGTPAAVMMAVTHSIAHMFGDPPMPPAMLLSFINKHLSARYTSDNGNFVTAFYGVFDPKTREIHYACAGHCPPRVKHGAKGNCVESLDQSLSLPLGIEPEEEFHNVTCKLSPGDALVLYTDGITEARKTNSSELFGMARLDAVLQSCPCDAETLIRRTLLAVEEFTDSSPPADDMTILVAKII